MCPIYTIIAIPLHFLRLPLSSIFCFIVALGLYTIVHCRISVCSCTWCWLPRLCLRGHQGRIPGCPRDPPNRVGACVWGDTKGSSEQHEGLCLRGHQGRIPASCNWGQHWGSLNCNVKKMLGWDFAYMLTFALMHHPFLVCILFGMPSLHLQCFYFLLTVRHVRTSSTSIYHRAVQFPHSHTIIHNLSCAQVHDTKLRALPATLWQSRTQLTACCERTFTDLACWKILPYQRVK